MRPNRQIWYVIVGLVILSLACSLTKETPEPTRRPTPAPVATAEPDEPTDTPKARQPTATTAPPTDTPRPKGSGLEIINETEEDIWYLYFSPSDSDQWGEDQLGGDIIPAGESYILTGISDGTYDIQARDSNNDVIQTTWELVVTSDSVWTILPSEMSTLEINNTSDTEIAYLYLSLTESDSWGPDILNGDVIPVNGSYTISNIEASIYDIRAEDANEDLIETLYNVPMDGDHYWNVVGIGDLPPNAVLRFEDDFTDNRNNWGLSDPGGADFSPPTNGEFCMEIIETNITAWEWYEPFRPDQFVAEVSCYTAPGTDATCGLGFGPDGDNLYWFEVSPSDQNFALFLLLNDEWQDALVSWTTSYNIYPTGANYLSLERIKGVVSVYINGVLQGRFNSDHFPTGRIGLGGSTYQQGNVTVCMDNLRVWRIE